MEDGDRENIIQAKAQSELVFANERYFVICLNRDLFATHSALGRTQIEIAQQQVKQKWK